jgi:nucleotide sugar dehydrogenase
MIDLLPKIGIIGLGVVGYAIMEDYESIANLILIDTDPRKGATGSYKEILETEAIFVCVPSPLNQDGSCNTKILESVLGNLKGYKGVIISKVTAPPDDYENLEKQYPNLVYVPEFLTAANAVRDYMHQKNFIIGGNIIAYQREAARILSYTKKDINTKFCSIGEAALVKYIVNTFLAVKVVFMNEMEAISSKKGYEWLTVSQLLETDPRIGKTHLKVPGPDGYRGFGGMCFPKDCAAFIHYAENMEINPHVLKEAVKKNTLLRLQKPK